MPFTLAHPAIVAPFGKSKFGLSATALVIGSMAPDFEFFFQMREVENIGHHWYGILLFDFPVALLLCYLFHNLLKHLLIINLPDWYRNRFIKILNFNWNAYAVTHKKTVVLSLLAGILSHIGWDAFTHYDGFFVELMPALSANISFRGTELSVFFLLQILSSVAGMLLLHFFIAAMPSSGSNVSYKRSAAYWPSFMFIFSFIVLIRVAFWPQYNSFWSVIMACLGGFVYSWILVSLIFNSNYAKKLCI